MTTSAPRRPRRSYAKTSARRQEIIDAAVEVFSAGGFHKGSLRDVAERAGLSQAGLLHHYPSKEALLEAVLEWRDDEATTYLGAPRPEGLELLRGLIRLAEYNLSAPELIELHVITSAEGTRPDNPINPYLVGRHTTVIRLVQAAFERAQAEGHVRPDVDCASAARTITALMDGLQVIWLLDRDGTDMVGDLRRYLQSLLTVEL